MIFDIIKHAKQLLYDNSKSKLNSTDVQGAVDELNESLSNYAPYNKGNLTSIVTSDYCTINSFGYEKVGPITILSLNITTNKDVPINAILIDSIPLRPAMNGHTISLYKYGAKDAYLGQILRGTENNMNKIRMYDTIPSGTTIRTELTFTSTLH